MKEIKNKIIFGWTMYDWANSVYSLVISTTFFPVYYIIITNGFFKNGIVSFYGKTFLNSVLYDYSISFSYLVVIFITPYLSAIADFYGNKLLFLKLFSFIGSISCCGLYFFTGKNIELGITFFTLATIGYACSIVFYNSYLTEIAEKEEQDSISAKGYIMGYIGSTIVQIIGFYLIMYLPFSINKTEATRITFLISGVWWGLFSRLSFKYLKLVKTYDLSNFLQKNRKQKISLKGYKTLLNVAKNINGYKDIKLFLLSFFFYNMGVQTIMLVAMSFGIKILNIPGNNLMIISVLIQITAIIGAYTASRLSKKINNIKIIIFMVLSFIFVCISAYYIKEKFQFYAISIFVGFIMGGIQSISRSTFSKFMPPVINDTTSYFSFYDVIEKLTIFLGVFVFGFIESLTNNMRNSILILIVFFIIGLILLLNMKHNLKRKHQNLLLVCRRTNP